MASKNTNYKNSEIKSKINERLGTIISESGKLAQTINRSSKSREILQQCTKSFTSLDGALSNTEQSLKLMEGVSLKLDVQFEKLNERLSKMNQLNDNVKRVNSLKIAKKT